MTGLARNLAGVGLSENSAEVGTVPALGNRIFEIWFLNTDLGESNPNYLVTVEYTITSLEGFSTSGVLGRTGPQSESTLEIRGVVRSQFRAVTTYVLEIDNTSTDDVVNVTLEARAKNSDGNAITDAAATVALIAAGRSELVTITFDGTSGSGERFVTGFDYVIASETHRGPAIAHLTAPTVGGPPAMGAVDAACSV